jgi:hypothetical protein
MGGKDGLDISTPKVVGGALAATTAAVAASFLGVTGTVIGAAVASVATTGGNTVYTHYIERGHRRLRERGLITGAPDTGDVAAQDEEGLARAAHATVREHGPAERPRTLDDAVPLDPGTAEVPRLTHTVSPRRAWTMMAVATAAIFALSMGGILAFELLSGKPLAATVHGRDGSGTSLGGTVRDATTPTPSPAVSEISGEQGKGSTPDPSSTASSPSDQQQTDPPPAESGAPSTSASPDGSGTETAPPQDDPGAVQPDTE